MNLLSGDSDIGEVIDVVDGVVTGPGVVDDLVVGVVVVEVEVLEVVTGGDV